MSRLESILKQAERLSPEELRRLSDQLLERLAHEAEQEEADAGQRGLASLTASLRGEDWSPFYPEDLCDREVPKA